MEEYYIIKKNDVEKLKSTLPNNLENNFDAGKIAALSMLGVELGELIDLSDEAIEKEAININKDNWKHLFYGNKLLYKRPIPVNFWKEVDASIRALKNLKQTLP